VRALELLTTLADGSVPLNAPAAQAVRRTVVEGLSNVPRDILWTHQLLKARVDAPELTRALVRVHKASRPRRGASQGLLT
jgi:hypothetical protein